MASNVYNAEKKIKLNEEKQKIEKAIVTQETAMADLKCMRNGQSFERCKIEDDLEQLKSQLGNIKACIQEIDRYLEDPQAYIKHFMDEINRRMKAITVIEIFHNENKRFTVFLVNETIKKAEHSLKKAKINFGEIMDNLHRDLRVIYFESEHDHEIYTLLNPSFIMGYTERHSLKDSQDKDISLFSESMRVQFQEYEKQQYLEAKMHFEAFSIYLENQHSFLLIYKKILSLNDRQIEMYYPVFTRAFILQAYLLHHENPVCREAVKEIYGDVLSKEEAISQYAQLADVCKGKPGELTMLGILLATIAFSLSFWCIPAALYSIEFFSIESVTLNVFITAATAVYAFIPMTLLFGIPNYFSNKRTGLSLSFFETANKVKKDDIVAVEAQSSGDCSAQDEFSENDACLMLRDF